MTFVRLARLVLCLHRWHFGWRSCRPFGIVGACGVWHWHARHLWWRFFWIDSWNLSGVKDEWVIQLPGQRTAG